MTRAHSKHREGGRAGIMRKSMVKKVWKMMEEKLMLQEEEMSNFF